MFSLHPLEAFRPPTLAGHKEGIVGVFWAGPRAAELAALDGAEAPHLFTVSRDGALFGWTFAEDAAARPADAEGAVALPESSSGDADEAAEGSEPGPAKRRRIEAPPGPNYAGGPFFALEYRASMQWPSTLAS